MSLILQSLILGPQLAGQSHLNTSSAFLLKFFDGSWPSEVPNMHRCLVDVRDCAEAHVNAIENWDAAAGRRFVLISTSSHFIDIANIVRDCVGKDLQANVPTAISSEVQPH